MFKKINGSQQRGRNTDATKHNLQHTKLLPAFYSRDTTTVAKDLLGKWLVHRVRGVKRIGRIVETESYLGTHDLASHSSRGKTKRNAAVFGPVGRAYVYLIYGMYECFNVVTEQEGKGSAILIRALEPIKNCVGKTNGPGLLCRTMHITRALNHRDLQSNTLYIARPKQIADITIVARPRIGVDYAKHWAKRCLRFYIKDNPFVSKK